MIRPPSKTSPMMPRRDIVRLGLRGAALLALTAVAATLGRRGRHGTCVRTDPCGACPWLPGCELPKARATQTRHAANRAAAAETHPKPRANHA